MNSPSSLLSLAIVYVCALFAVAWYVDRRSDTSSARRSPRWRGAIYALSLAVYCSSWTFYGAVGSATASPWSHAPIYLGPILVFVFAWPLLRRLMRLGTRHRVTSIADYLGARFGKRQLLSILVTAVATAAVLPYIALQFRALTQAWSIIASQDSASVSPEGSGLTVAIILALFTILFGARRMDGRERHQGMMSAVALESLVKFLAFLCVAILALLYLRRPEVAEAVDWSTQSLARVDLSADFFARTLISAFAILCLPRQFHVMVVEAQEKTHSRFARWVFPAYLGLFMVLVVPVSLAGSHLAAALGGAVATPDTYVQWLPGALNKPWVSLVAFVGGISAATGMVIVATVSLAIMLTNEVAVPVMIRRQAQAGTALLALGNNLRRVRQVTIVLILVAAWIVSRQLQGIPWLSEIGFMSFLAAAQLAPGLLAGLYWRRCHGLAVTAGLVAGLLLWFYCLVLPAVLGPGTSLLREGLFGLQFLRPQALGGWEGPGPLSYAAILSLGINSALMAGLSWVLRPSTADMRQASVFMDLPSRRAGEGGDDFDLSPVRAGQLRALLPPFLDDARLQQLWRSFEARYQQRLLPADRMPLFAVREVESTLAGVIGAASASRVMTELTESRQLDFADLASLVSDAGRQQTFNRELLESTVESMLQGVSVVDEELRLVAWNTRYEQMFNYPERFLYIGMPIARLYRFNAERGVMGVNEQDIDAEVEKRLNWLRKGHPHRLERRLPDGRVIDIHGVPLGSGGFVTTYVDITDYRDMVTELEEARLELEDKVASGKSSLAETNAELRRENRLRAEAESKLREANLSKSRFMSATSHDLLQPINAARLFVAALRPRLGGQDEVAQTVAKIDQSLGRAEQLIAELREVARLDSGAQQPKLEPVAVDALLRELYAEFAPQAGSRGLELRLRSSSLWMTTDRTLLYRTMQNIVSNAIKYARKGKVLIGARRRAGMVELQVLDQGPGIAQEDQSRVFAEFERVESSSHDEEGLGLGLAIVSRYARLLEIPLQLRSEPGRGCLFSLRVPLASQRTVIADVPTAASQAGRLRQVRVLCIDNDARVREALAAILEAEGSQVEVVAERDGLRRELTRFRPHVVVADYHLDAGDNGIAALIWAFGAGARVPCIIVSADDGEHVRQAAKAEGFRSLPKPVNPARLTALIHALVSDADGGAGFRGRAAVPPGA